MQEELEAKPIRFHANDGKETKMIVLSGSKTLANARGAISRAFGLSPEHLTSLELKLRVLGNESSVALTEEAVATLHDDLIMFTTAIPTKD